MFRRVFFLLCLTIVALACSSNGDSQQANEGSPEAVATVAPTEPAVVESTEPAEPPVSEATAEPEGPEWTFGDSEYLFDQGELRTYEFTLSDENMAFLDGDPTAEEYAEGTFSFEGQEVGTVGVRYKGSIGAFVGCVEGPIFDPSGAKTCTKLSMKIKINWDGTENTFYEQKKLQFHAMNGDASLMRERLGYYMFGAMGVPSPRAVHARVVVNGEFVGVFALIEQIDGRFAREYFDDGTGNLYKEVWPLTGTGTIQAESDVLAGLKTNENEDPSLELINQFSQALLDASDEELPAVLEQWTNVDELMSYAAVDRTIRHDDGPFHWYCGGIAGGGAGCSPHNFYWYEDPTSQTFHLIPWDLDYAFENIISARNPVTPIADAWGETQGDCEGFVYGSFSITQRSAACDRLVLGMVMFDELYASKLAEFKAGPFAQENVAQLLTEWTDQIADAVAEANELHDDALSPDAWERAVNTLRDQTVFAQEN